MRNVNHFNTLFVAVPDSVHEQSKQFEAEAKAISLESAKQRINEEFRNGSRFVRVTAGSIEGPFYSTLFIVNAGSSVDAKEQAIEFKSAGTLNGARRQAKKMLADHCGR